MIFNFCLIQVYRSEFDFIKSATINKRLEKLLFEGGENIYYVWKNVRELRSNEEIFLLE